ncbi:MAG: efflux RND transporter periplasmic adaptor subunit [Hyphomicrobiales bacterium]|nr:efflux RND transporter periplasmic adaptor subunit [Hyphomicrobiales bacterium]
MPVKKNIGKTKKSSRTPTRERITGALGPIRSSYLWAALLTLVIAGWMLSGELLGNARTGVSAGDLAASGSAGKKNDLFRVEVKTFQARARDASLVLRGRTEADARVDLQAETAGVVERLPVAKGARVNKGDIVCKLETGARQAMLDKAEAERRQAELDYQASEKLERKGHTAKLKVAEYDAKLDAASATLRQAQLDLNRTAIKAPFDGVVEAQPAKPGDYLAVGETCTTLVALDPLIVVASVSERQVGKLRLGMSASAKLATGETVTGPVRFIASAADSKTRTFQIELEVANSDGALRDGVTADITIPLASKPAHKFSPAILALNDAGEIGVRMIENGDTVRFAPVTILTDDADGIWVSGLPETVMVIIAGQDYVTDGQKVEAVTGSGSARR